MPNKTQQQQHPVQWFTIISADPNVVPTTNQLNDKTDITTRDQENALVQAHYIKYPVQVSTPDASALHADLLNVVPTTNQLDDKTDEGNAPIQAH